MTRVYLDWNATGPLRPEARDAMIAAMDVVGNPSSVHAEGRKAKAIVETARGQVAAAFGADRDQVIFNSGASESAAMAAPDGFGLPTTVEHDAILNSFLGLNEEQEFPVFDTGIADLAPVLAKLDEDTFRPHGVAIQSANSETGVVQDVQTAVRTLSAHKNAPEITVDAVQAAGRVPFAFAWLGADFALLSAHKFGGPKGVGALLSKSTESGGRYSQFATAGSQEKGQRAGTENVIGIAGFGAAAEAAQRDLDNGVWEPVRELRDTLEARLADAAPDAIFVGQGVDRLPNTSCIAVPGWKGETQVMQMDLAGYAISAGSACSSGKVKQSRVLTAMGFDDITASSAIRVSFGPTTTPDEVMGFADAWIAQYKKFKARAA
ncbi:cysteine desulfurase family protein [Amylibacter sp. IMCC11727]|uniref:cysteine desulfurase family protein n=1 Tax=Amylibacter sp. IMCC11727 TaxID=3039851 RepID=UPI00244E58D0|nr:cysteine desulfurase family protein [Amylibacter sp. IMCC11727]WGI20413.1 cysteine desulfurase family protein [Amylibacter sp. IMCC11727]